MSYILEALKRSQQERNRGQVPTLASHVPLQPPRWSGLRYLLLGILVVGAGVILVSAYQTFLQPGVSFQGASTPVQEQGKGSEVSSPVSSGAGEQTASSPAREVAPAQLAANKAMPMAETPGSSSEQAALQAKPDRQRNRLTNEPKEQAGASQRTPGEAKVARRLPLESSAPAHPKTAQGESQVMQTLRTETESFQDNLRRLVTEAQSHLPGQKATTPEPKKPQSQGETTAPLSRPVPGGQDAAPAAKPSDTAAVGPTPSEDKQALPPLPPEVESALPSIRILAHVYRDEVVKRFVILNGQKLGEGQSTRDGLLVEAIQPEGVRLGFRGHSLYRSR